MDSIRIKRGMSTELPKSLPLGELAFCIDTRELWVGSGDGLALKRVTNTEITQHLDEWNALYTEVDERFETKYVDVSAQFSEKFNELCQQFATKSDALDTQFANKYSELSQQFQNKYNNLEREYAQQVHSAMTLSADNKQSIDLLKRDIGTTANIEDLQQVNNQATETLEQLNQVKTELESDVLVIKDIEKDTKKAHIDYEGNHHDSLKDSMDANIDFIKGEFNTTHMTGENITCENTILRHIKRAEMRGHTELNCIKEPSGKEVVLPYEFDETQKDFTLEDTKDTGSLNIVLKGNTEVNVLKNPMRDYVVPYEFEEGYTATLTDTKETGSIQSAILKGCTLVNLAIEKGIVFTDADQWRSLRLNQSLLNSSKKYLISFDSSHDFKGYVHLRDTATNTYITNTTLTLFKQGNNKILITDFLQTELNTFADIRVTFYLNNGSVVFPTISNVILLEYVEGMENWDIPYFEGMQSVKMPVLKTTGKNLIQQMTFKKSGDRNISNETIKVTKGVTYTLSFSSGIINTALSLMRDNKSTPPIPTEHESVVQNLAIFSNYNSVTFTAVETGEFYLHFRGNVTETSESLSNSNIQLEEGSVATSYEPYKSNILTVNEPIELRGIGKVRDTLDCLTGEVTERIGEVVLDGSEEWRIRNGDIVQYFDTIIENIFDGNLKISCISNKLQCYTGHEIHSKETYGLGTSTNTIKLRIPNCLTVDELKLWLSQNPITVQYELETESVKTVDLSILDQDGLSVPALSTYNEVTYINTTVPENSLKPLISSKTPEFPVMIKPNTKYSIVADTTTNGFDEIPLTYNLGGAEVETEIGNKVTVIQTPSTLTNETFKVTGTGMKLSNVMILEKDLTGKEIPNYTEGMQSVQMPVLTTTGKNLVNLDKSNPDGLGYNSGNGTSAIEYDNDKQGFYTKTNRGMCANLAVKPNTYYTISADFLKRGDNGYSFLWQNPTQSAGDTYNSTDFSATEWRRKSVTRLSDENGKIKWIVYGAVYFKNLQVEEGTQATPYEPYKSNILTVNEDVTLRGIGDVKDELNVATGELTQRIGEIVLDGSENWNKYTIYPIDGYTAFITTIPSLNNLYRGSLSFISADFPTGTWNDYVGMVKTEFVWNHDPNKIGIRVKNEIATDVNGIKAFLSNNNIKINYQLETESVKTVDFTITNQNGQKVDELSTFNGVTYVESSVAENSLKPIISHKDLEYEVLLKPNTKYSIITNPISNEHPNSPISFDLGGQQVETTVGSYCTLVTTPNSLTHNKLVMKGRGNKLRGGVMVIEGDKTGMMLNHFDGMKSVEEFTVKVANNNLFNKDYYDWSKYSGGTGQITGIHEYGGRKNCIFTNPALFPQFTHVKPNKQYTVKFDTLKLDDNGYGFLGVEFNYTDGTVEHKSRVSGNVGVWKTSMATSNASKQIKSIKIQNAYNGGWGAFIDLDSFVIVEGTSIPQVESRHNSLPLIIPLRSLPNGVRDTLNLVTGEYVQRVAEHVLDGTTTNATTDWRKCWGDYSVNTVTFEGYRPNPLPVNRNDAQTTSIPSYLISDKIKVLGFGSMWQNGQAVDRETSLTTYGGGQLIFVIDKDKLETQDVTGFKKWLSENPVTIQYELQEPIVTKLDLAWKDGKLFAYDGKTHIYVDVEGNKLQPMLDIHVPVNIVAELSRLRQEKEQLEISKTQLENQLSLIQYHNSDLVSNVENLVAENLMLKQQTQDLQNNSSVLQLKNRELSKHQEKLRNENLELQKRAKALTHTTENLHHKLHVVDSVREAGDLELLSSDFELDFRLMEIEFALDIPISLSVKGVSRMARTPFEMAKTLILGGKYDREDMENKLKVYRDRGKITLAEYDELVALMDANELA